ncbi:MAG: FAD-binding oxidoreductase, partial [Actinobacteria bacterium]|nr:FAD-binding oxidoreductase [Actinomycetota bacterium]
HKAVMGMTADARLLDATGVRWRELDAGCCGLAGAFGFEAGEKAELSVAIGESRLLPAIRALPADTLLLVDGFSCRTQIEHLQDVRRPLHLAELLLAAVRGGEPGDRTARRPATGVTARDARTLAAGAAALGLATALVRLAVRSARRRRRVVPSPVPDTRRSVR